VVRSFANDCSSDWKLKSKAIHLEIAVFFLNKCIPVIVNLICQCKRYNWYHSFAEIISKKNGRQVTAGSPYRTPKSASVRGDLRHFR